MPHSYDEIIVADVRGYRHNLWQIWGDNRKAYYCHDYRLLSKLQLGFHVRVFCRRNEGYTNILEVQILDPVKPKGLTDKDREDLKLIGGDDGRSCGIVEHDLPNG